MLYRGPEGQVAFDDAAGCRMAEASAPCALKSSGCNGLIVDRALKVICCFHHPPVTMVSQIGNYRPFPFLIVPSCATASCRNIFVWCLKHLESLSKSHFAFVFCLWLVLLFRSLHLFNRWRSTVAGFQVPRPGCMAARLPGSPASELEGTCILRPGSLMFPLRT